MTSTFSIPAVRRASATKRSGAAHISRVFGKRADAGNPKKIFELVEKSFLISLDEGIDGLGHTLL